MGKTVKMSLEGKSQQEPRNWQMDRILIILKKENGPRASSAPALGLNTMIFKHVYWYMQQTQVSVYRTIGPLVIPRHLKSAGYYVIPSKKHLRTSVCPSVHQRFVSGLYLEHLLTDFLQTLYRSSYQEGVVWD